MGKASQTTPVRVLVVDDDPITAESLCDFLGELGYPTAMAFSADEALREIERAESTKASGEGVSPIGVVISDVSMPGVTGSDQGAGRDSGHGSGGLSLLRTIGKRHPSVAVLMLTGYGTIESAVQAVRNGAVDYLTKPVVDNELKLALERAIRQHTLLAENHRLKDKLQQRTGMQTIVGSDARMLKMYELIEAVAPSRTTVLMSGESGVGKSLIAQAIHQHSPRKDKPFVQLSCGSIPETLLESELFGHVKGAFTGAYADKVGRFLAADGGTLFLDEINSASPGMQLKLPRVLQERKFEPVGSTQTIESDVRVVLATNKPLEELVARGEFRQDLYYRINVVKIDLPPLRERVSDIPMLAQHFLTKHGSNLGREFMGFSPAAMELLKKYRYPGNVRELENIVERAAVLSKSATITPEALPEQVQEDAGPNPMSFSMNSLAGSASLVTNSQSDQTWVPIPLEDALRDPERLILLKALRANQWNRQKTADDLKINRTTLYKKMKQLNIESDPERLAG